MPVCSIKQCSARKNINQPQLTVHRFPKSEPLRRKWLDNIGTENINSRHKDLYACSLHFEESCFNETLEVIRLRDNAVPSLCLPPKYTNIPVLQDVSNTSEKSLPTMTRPHLPEEDAPFVKGEPSTLLKLDDLSLPSTSTSVPSTNLPVVCEMSIARELKLPMMAPSHSLVPNVGPFCEQKRQRSISFIKMQKVCDEQRKKIKRLNEKVRRQVKKITNMHDIITDLRNKLIINTEQSILLEECGGSKEFLNRQISKSKGLPVEKKYTEEIRKFALTLHFLSPKAYEFIRKVYNSCLPHPRTLSKWYQHVNAEPGFTKEAFDTLRKKVEQSRPQKVLCALVLDEMAIRKALIWDPKTQKYHGRVEYGHNIDCDSQEEASQCLVLLLTCVNGSWKLPIGYFFITSVTGEQKSVLVETAIKLTEDTGTRVISVTCDGPAANFSMLSTLGCDITKDQACTTFESSNAKPVHAFIDPCHAIKLIRNTLGDLRVFIDGSGRQIDFKYFERLLELQDKQGLHLATKITKAHIFFEKQKMKVKLATQLLSNSVADALIFCKEELQLKEFEDCEGTAIFINTMNNIFDVLNSHSIRPPGLKKAMCPENIGLIRALFEGAIEYIRSLRLPSGELLVQSRRKTGFIGLIIDMKSALKMYEKVVEKEELLKYIPLYKVSQDHLELFFSSIRSRGGFNNNPNAVQFRAAYKRLLVRAEIRDGGIGNCIPLEQVNILTCSSKNPVQTLNELTERNRFVEIDEDHSDLYDEYLNLMTQDIDKYQTSVIEYIAGFITKKISKIIKCDQCISLLSGPTNEKSLIYIKSRGGLTYASADVINIINKAENLIKHDLNNKVNPEHYYLYIFKFLVEYYDSEKYFALNPEHDSIHRVLLIKSVIKAFIDLRYRYFGRKASEKLSYRQYFSKLILFRNE